MQLFKREQVELEGALEEIGLERLPVQNLKRTRGIGTIIGSGLIAEMIDVRRFPSEDNLASYSGLGRVEDKTGERESTKRARKYNRRLKDLFMTAALKVVQFDPNSHLAGYHRNLVKKGMEPTEATKRVARALVRVIYRELMALIEANADRQTAEAEEKGQSGVASGRGRGDKQRLSNTPPSSPKDNGTCGSTRVKRTGRARPRISSRTVASTRGPRLTKSA